MDTHWNYAEIFKALSDETRLKIVEMLSCGEMCACAILEYFEITQPTLSYHMKILTDSNIVISKKEGTWIRYNLNHDLMNSMKKYWDQITEGKDDCICRNLSSSTQC
jgi:ArsR family transcriptional regulator